MSGENQYSESALMGNLIEESSVPSSNTRTNLRSESADSGVETASSDTPSPTTYSVVSAEIAQTDVFKLEREVKRLTSPTSSQSSSSSSSLSSCLHTSTAQDGSTASKVELLQRNDNLMKKPERLTVEEVLRRRPRSSLPPRQNTSVIMRSQRSQSFTPRRTVYPAVSIRQMSVMWKQKSPVSCEKQRPEVRYFSNVQAFKAFGVNTSFHNNAEILCVINEPKYPQT